MTTIEIRGLLNDIESDGGASLREVVLMEFLKKFLQ